MLLNADRAGFLLSVHPVGSWIVLWTGLINPVSSERGVGARLKVFPPNRFNGFSHPIGFLHQETVETVAGRARTSGATPL
jgi:hypothetical protein